MNMSIIFDALITALGVVILFYAVKMKRSKTIPGFFVPPEEISHARDLPGFAAFLFPRALLFSIVCMLFGVQGLVNDLIFSMHHIINLVMILVFIAVWVWFSVQLRQGRERYV